MYNKATERNETKRTNNLHSLTHSRSLTLHSLVTAVAAAGCLHEQHKHDGKKFNCTGVAAIPICIRSVPVSLARSLARIFFIWPCISCVAEI